MAEDYRELVSEDEATVVVMPPDHSDLVEAFRAWAGGNAELRALFTPDVLIGLDAPTRRGYLYDDGWTVEVWIERGLTDFFRLLSPDYLAKHCRVERSAPGPLPQRELLSMALEEGEPISEVRHLI